jgi:hypothetical protein
MMEYFDCLRNFIIKGLKIHCFIINFVFFIYSFFICVDFNHSKVRLYLKINFNLSLKIILYIIRSIFISYLIFKLIIY